MELKDVLSEEQFNMAIQFVEQAEPRVAFEIVCEQILEDDIHVAAKTIQMIEVLGEYMGADPIFWKDIEILE